MGTITHGPKELAKKPSLGLVLVEVLKEAEQSSVVMPMEAISPIKNIDPIIPQKEQVVIGTKTVDKRVRQHSKLVAKKVEDFASTLDEILLEQKREKSTLQMQLSEIKNQIQRTANASAKNQIEQDKRLDMLNTKMDLIADHRPNVAEIHRVETKRISKTLVFFNILLLAAVAVLLCKK